MKWRKSLDKYYPVVLSLSSAAFFFLFFREYRFPENSLRDLLCSVINIGAIAVGFLVTAKSILIAIDDRPIIRFIRDAGRYNDMIDYFISAIRWSFFLSILSAVYLTIDWKSPQPYHQRLETFWIFVAANATLTAHRVIRLLTVLMKSNPSKNRPPS